MWCNAFGLFRVLSSSAETLEPAINNWPHTVRWSLSSHVTLTRMLQPAPHWRRANRPPDGRPSPRFSGQLTTRLTRTRPLPVPRAIRIGCRRHFLRRNGFHLIEDFTQTRLRVVPDVGIEPRDHHGQEFVAERYVVLRSNSDEDLDRGERLTDAKRDVDAVGVHSAEIRVCCGGKLPGQRVIVGSRWNRRSTCCGHLGLIRSAIWSASNVGPIAAWRLPSRFRVAGAGVHCLQPRRLAHSSVACRLTVSWFRSFHCEIPRAAHAGGMVVAAEEQRMIGQVVDRLRTQFPPVPPTTVQETVGSVHHRFDAAPIRDFVPLFVERHTRAELGRLSG